MNPKKQLWVLAGGNGAGKSTFHRLFLAPLGLKLINADILAKELNRAKPEKASYRAAHIIGQLRDALVEEGVSFCFETVFSHVSKVDFAAKAKALGYKIILVYIHLDYSELNIARVKQRVSEGGHDVPIDKIKSRIPKTMQNIRAAIPLADETRLLNNSSASNPFAQVATLKKGLLIESIDPLPDWAQEMLGIKNKK